MTLEYRCSECGARLETSAILPQAAALIEAAPEMLALLIDLYEHGYTTFADHDRVRDIIAKAQVSQPSAVRD